MLKVPKSKEFIWLNFNPQAGHEQRGRRPGLVVSKTPFNEKMGFVWICPVSSTPRENPFYVKISEGIGIGVEGKIFCDQLRSLDFRARGFDPSKDTICQCPELLFKDVLRRIKPILF